MELRERYRGALLGLATGDALGTTLEFRAPGTFRPLTDMVGGGPFNLKPGQWTDDTSLALCLAESLVECRGFDPQDQMNRYGRWGREGYLSSTGQCFDIGGTTMTALCAYSFSDAPFSGPTEPHTAGNGSLMRLAPAPLFYAAEPAVAILMAGDSSRTTHGAAAAVDACRYFGALLVGAVHGVTKEQLLGTLYAPIPGYWEAHPLVPEVAAVADGRLAARDPHKIVGSGYVVNTLEAALWAWATTDNFRDGCLRVVNLGDDADTTGAVYGQLAGAYYGVEAIPASWRGKLTMHDRIVALADALCDLAWCRRGR